MSNICHIHGVQKIEQNSHDHAPAVCPTCRAERERDTE